MKALALMLISPLALFAVDTRIVAMSQDGSKTSLTLDSYYQMSERESMADAREHTLEHAKQFAIEYVGRKIETSQAVSMIGDAALSRTKKYILATSSAITTASITEESVASGLKYHQVVMLSVDPEQSMNEVERAKKIETLIGKYQDGTLLQQQNITSVFNAERSKTLEKFAGEIVRNSVPACQRINVKIVYNNIIEKYLCHFSASPEAVGNYHEYYRGEVCSVKMSKRGQGSDKIRFHTEEEVLNTSNNLEFSDVKLSYGKPLACDMDYVVQDLTWEEYFAVPGFSSAIKIPMIKNGIPIESGDFLIELKRRGSAGEGYDIRMQRRGSEVKPLVVDPSFSL